MSETVLQTVKSDLSWLQRHERLILALIITMALIFLGNKWMDSRAQKDSVQAALLAQQVATEKANNAEIASQNAQIASQYQAMVQTLQQQNAALAAAVAQRDTALAKQQTTNATLPLPDLAKRWETLANLQPTDFTATDNGITVNDTAAVATVNQLEEVPVLQANLKDETQIADNRQAELSKANDVIGGLNGQVAGLNKQIADDDKACKAEVTAVKAEARKSKRNWFIAGFIAGVGTRLLGHF